MKKSLSVLVATAMVSSMFASVAFAADDELTTQQKLDELIAAGIFDKDGTGNGSELDAHMTREQLAKILAKLKKLEEVSGTSYTDVAADRWSAGFIQAVSKVVPPLMDGVADGVFDPAGDVTLEQLATVAVRALNLQVKSDAEVEGEVSDWAKGYVAAALENGLIGEKDDYTEPAIRSDLVETTYSARDILAESEKVSVTSAKPVGVKTVQVTFNKAVEDSAKLALKKGSIDIATDVKLADDKKSATLTLKDTKLMAGTYTVTLSGVDNIDKDSAEFTAEDEKVTKLEFVSSSDTIAKADNVIVKLKATNQYGENASASAGSFTVYAGNNNDVYKKLSKNEAGELLLYLDTNLDDPSTPTNESPYTEGLSIIPVNIYHNDTRVSVSKNFKLGTAPFVTKMELGELKYSNGKDALNGTGETATVDVVNYDQYGNIIPYNPSTDPANTRVVINGYEPALVTEVGDNNNDEVADVKFSLNKNVDKNAEYTFTVYNQAGTASGKIAVKSAKIATKIELGDVTDVIAAGDTEAYIPIIAYDANGNQLSVDDLVSEENQKQIQISASTDNSSIAGDESELVLAGENKGKIRLTNLPNTPRSIVSVTAFIATPNANSTANKTYTVADARIPDFIKAVTEPAKKLVAGASSDFKFEVYDQYGKKLKKLNDISANGQVVTASAGSDVQYRISVTASTYDGSIVAYNNKGTYDPATGWNTAAGGNFAAQSYIYGTDVDTIFNQTHKFTSTSAAAGFATIEAVVQKKRVDATSWTDVTNKVTRKIEVINANETLTYTVNSVKDLFNAIDSSSVYAAVYNDAGLTLGVETEQEKASLSKFAREVTVSAIDAAGNKVALPKNITGITSSDVRYARVENDPANKKAWVIGKAKGSATLNVTFTTHKGETLLQTVTVNVKDDPIAATSISSDKEKNVSDIISGTTNAFVIGNIKVVDNYGVEYAKDYLQKYNYLFGVAFSVKNVVGGGTVNVSQYGTITTSGTVYSFELVATDAQGHSTTIFFK